MERRYAEQKKFVENSFSFFTEEGNFYRLDIERAKILRLELI